MHIRRAAVGLMILVIGLGAGCTDRAPGKVTVTPAVQPAISSPSATVMETLRPPVTPAPANTPAPHITTPANLPYLQDGGPLMPGSVARIGVGNIEQAALFPDRQRMLVSTDAGIYVYQLPGFERLWRRETGFVLGDVRLSPDGSRVLADNGEPWGHSDLYDAATGKRVASPEGGSEHAWSGDGRYLMLLKAASFAVNLPITFGVYASSSGDYVTTFEFPDGTSAWRDWERPYLASSPDGNTIAGCSDRTFTVWKTPDFSVISTGDIMGDLGPTQTFTSERPSYSCDLKFSQDSRYLAVDDSTGVRVFDLASGAMVFKTPDRLAGWGPERLYVDNQTQVSIYGTTDWARQSLVSYAFSNLTVSPSGKYLFGTSETSGRIYTSDTWAPLIDLTGIKSYADVEWSPGERRAAIYDGSTQVISTPGRQGEFPQRTNDLRLRFVDDDTMWGIYDRSIFLLSPSTWQVLNGYRLTFDVNSLAWTPDSKSLVFQNSTSPDYWVWSAETGQVTQSGRLRPETETFQPSADSNFGQNDFELISPDGTYRLSATTDNRNYEGGPFGGFGGAFGGTMTVTRLDTGAAVISEVYDKEGLNGAAWSQDSHFIALAYAGIGGPLTDHILIVNVQSGEVIDDFDGAGKYVTALLFSPDGQHLAARLEDGTISIWNTSH